MGLARGVSTSQYLRQGVPSLTRVVNGENLVIGDRTRDWVKIEELAAYYPAAKKKTAHWHNL